MLSGGYDTWCYLGDRTLDAIWGIGHLVLSGAIGHLVLSGAMGHLVLSGGIGHLVLSEGG